MYQIVNVIFNEFSWNLEPARGCSRWKCLRHQFNLTTDVSCVIICYYGSKKGLFPAYFYLLNVELFWLIGCSGKKLKSFTTLSTLF